jgi:phosphoglycolate phosphatase-like HAD superfamily hydrolase
MLDSPVVSAGRVLRAAQAVIFDVEGTLLDSVPATLQSWQEVLRAFGHEVSRSQLQELSGRDTDELLAELLPQVPEATRTRIGKEQGRHYRACYLDNVGAIPGVAKVLAEFRQAGKRIALGTSCERDELDHYLAVAGCGDLVDYIACGDDARRGKPHPDLFALALRRLGVAARAAVVVGDTPYDAQAAAAVGLPAIGVLTGGFSTSDLRCAGCVDVVEAVTDLGASDEKVRS